MLKELEQFDQSASQAAAVMEAEIQKLDKNDEKGYRLVREQFQNKFEEAQAKVLAKLDEGDEIEEYPIPYDIQ